MINLKKEFGSKYRVFYDPSWDAETADNRTEARKSDAESWYYELRGPQVIISPRSADTVAARWIGLGNKALFQAATSIRVLDGEVLYIIPNSALKGVLGAVKVYRKRQVTEAVRARGCALAAKYGFGKK